MSEHAVALISYIVERPDCSDFVSWYSLKCTGSGLVMMLYELGDSYKSAFDMNKLMVGRGCASKSIARR